MDETENPEPPLWQTNLSGTWRLDTDRSDKWSALLEALGVPWLVRKMVVVQWSATAVVEHTDTDFVVTTKTKLGTDLQSHRLDGHRHVMERMGKAATVAATWAHCKLVIDVQFTGAPTPAMRYVETRRLVEPDVQLQVLRVFKDHRLVHTCSRVWQRSASHDRPATALTPVTNAGAQRSHQVDSAAQQAEATPTQAATSAQPATNTERGGVDSPPLAWSQAPPAVRRVYVAIATAALVLAVALIAIMLPSLLYVPAFAVIGVEVLHRRRLARQTARAADPAQAATAHGEDGGGT